MDYPESTLAWLENFNKNFAEKRGDDSNYKFAQLLRSSSKDAETYNLDSSTETGWGVVAYDSYDGSYNYVLHTNGTVTY